MTPASNSRPASAFRPRARSLRATPPNPGPARIAALRDLARERGIACVFSEPQFDGGRVRAVFDDTVRHGVLDPLGSAHAPGPALYPALLGDMAMALGECLGGS